LSPRKRRAIPDDRSQTLEGFETEQALGDRTFGWDVKPANRLDGVTPAQGMRRPTVTKALLRQRRLAQVR
jgi:hypothetical protein